MRALNAFIVHLNTLFISINIMVANATDVNIIAKPLRYNECFLRPHSKR